MVKRHVSLGEMTIGIVIAWLLLLGIIVYTYYHLRQCRKILSVPQQFLHALSNSQDDLQSSQRGVSVPTEKLIKCPIKVDAAKIRTSRKLGDVSSTIFSCISGVVTGTSPSMELISSVHSGNNSEVKAQVVLVPPLVFRLGPSRTIMSTLASIQGMC